MSVSATAETVYKKTNSDGSVTFSDQASTGSEEVKIRKSSTYKSTKFKRLTLPTKKINSSYKYSLSITQPVKDSVIVNQQSVTISVSVQPALRSGFGHKLRYQLSGQTILSSSTVERFKGIPRGSHNVSVHVVDANGSSLSPVATTSFHMKRFFIRPPAPPRPPAAN